jgi:asparagine synthase (glutamine-hydrolysing)
MCGITGIYAFNELGKFHMINLSVATATLERRGPDFGKNVIQDRVGLGHRRLSIIDTSADGNQPMRDSSGRYTIVFNGEIYNYRELRAQLEARQIAFQSATDTEVLLQLYIQEGADCLQKLNGFFAFAIYDQEEDILFVARDRIGIKPLLYYLDEDKLIFASEMKSILAYGIAKELDYTSLYHYLQLNYIPAPHTILKDIKKLMPGHYMEISKPRTERVKVEQYYQIPYNEKTLNAENLSYGELQRQLEIVMEKSVQRRLVADVPLGAFLSGGIDSSVITALASRHVEKLNTFSIGYRDAPFFDETKYARLVADKFKTEHTVFSLTTRNLYDYLFEMLDYIDEPFADSSALPVYILSKETKRKATVALSGDGADEIFSGYNKHAAAYRAMQSGMRTDAVKSLLPVWELLPKSRSNPFGNKIRQLQRFAEGASLSPKDRYWRWATLASSEQATRWLSSAALEKLCFEVAEKRENEMMKFFSGKEVFNEVLYTDAHLVLPNDMLTKVDLMSMAQGLEVRVPFLDHEVVEFAFHLPAHAKINKQMRKRIVQDTFREVLPPQLYQRPKKGFEVPLLQWFRTELKSLITDDLLGKTFIEEQGIFDTEEIERLKKKLFSNNPGDVHANIWALIVFQWWWKKYFTTSN